MDTATWMRAEERLGGGGGAAGWGFRALGAARHLVQHRQEHGRRGDHDPRRLGAGLHGARLRRRRALAPGLGHVPAASYAANVGSARRHARSAPPTTSGLSRPSSPPIPRAASWWCRHLQRLQGRQRPVQLLQPRVLPPLGHGEPEILPFPRPAAGGRGAEGPALDPAASGDMDELRLGQPRHRPVDPR